MLFLMLYACVLPVYSFYFLFFPFFNYFDKETAMLVVTIIHGRPYCFLKASVRHHMTVWLSLCLKADAYATLKEASPQKITIVTNLNIFIIHISYENTKSRQQKTFKKIYVSQYEIPYTALNIKLILSLDTFHETFTSSGYK